jgi:hypothetical protein
MHRTRRALALLCLFLPASLAAQAPAATSPDPAADRTAVLAVVQRLFDGMRKGDSTMIRSVFHPKATLATAGATREGAPTLTFGNVDEFVKGAGTPRAEALDERTYEPVVHLDGNLASVWTEYSLFIGTRFSHCGIDAFQLARTPDGWRIFQLTDTRRRTGCRTS